MNEVQKPSQTEVPRAPQPTELVIPTQPEAKPISPNQPEKELVGPSQEELESLFDETEFLGVLTEAARNVTLQIESNGEINRDARRERWTLTVTSRWTDSKLKITISSWHRETPLQVGDGKIVFIWANGHNLTLPCKTDISEDGVDKDAEKVIKIANIINCLRRKWGILGGERFSTESRQLMKGGSTKILSTNEVKKLWVDPIHLDRFIQEMRYLEREETLANRPSRQQVQAQRRQTKEDALEQRKQNRASNTTSSPKNPEYTYISTYN